jgi:hypothetical protein
MDGRGQERGRAGAHTVSTPSQHLGEIDADCQLSMRCVSLGHAGDCLYYVIGSSWSTAGPVGSSARYARRVRYGQSQVQLDWAKCIVRTPHRLSHLV